MGRVIGAFFILCGAVGFGWYLAQQARRHLEILCEIKRALICMCGDLEYARFPMQELLANAQQCVDESVADCFREIEQEIETQAGENVAKIWFRVWEDHAKKLSLQSGELLIIQQAGQKLGNMELQQQVELLRFAQKQLEERIAVLQGEEKETEKLYRSLSFLGGLFLVVLLF
ncbi:MAG: stage III sporulation protein AB [Lachnospiraceae bacterium]